MPELRWTLLILGALFIGGLAIWEWRRKKHARGQQLGQPLGQPRDGERLAPTLDQTFDNDAPRGAAPEKQRGDARMFREPTLTLPDDHADGRDRTPVSEPRVVELDDASLAELKVDRQEVVDEFSGSGRQADAGLDEGLPEEDVEPISAREGEAPEGTMPAMSAAEIAFNDEVFQQQQEEEQEGEEEDQDEAEEQEESESAATSTGNGFAVADAGLAAEPIVEWPDEDSRKIIALRLVSGAGERFAGRAVRLALAAEGFLPGKFDIFHKPGPDSRAVLSAASLTKPGTFAVNAMDAQRYGGLSLFAVLPGPLPPVATFDELLVTARSLNDRLRGALQDERGEPLTPMRSANIRDSLSAAAASQTHDSSPA